MEIRTIPVGELETNCYLAWEEDKQAVVIDPGAEAGRILGEAEKAGVQVRQVLLTHVHFDHMLAAREVMEATGAGLSVHEADAAALTNPARSLLALFMPGRRYALSAGRLLTEGDTVEAGQLKLTVLHTPGHTPGSVCFRTGGVIFSGDTLFMDGEGRTDFPGGDPAAMRASLRRLAELPDDYAVYPGHGPATTLSRERRYNPWMAGI